MTDKHPSAEIAKAAKGSVGNLGQNKAKREKISDEKMSHMEKDSYRPQKQNEKRRPQHKQS